MLIQSSCLVLCLVSLIFLKSHSPTTHPSTFSCFHSALPPPIPFPETCPITVTVIAPAWVIPQRVRAGDTEPAPPQCALWQNHVSTATVDDVRMPPRGGHHPLPLSFSVHYTDSTGYWSVGRKVCQNVQGCTGFFGQAQTVCELINAKSQWLWPVKQLLITASVWNVNNHCWLHRYLTYHWDNNHLDLCFLPRQSCYLLNWLMS